jgi:hypothetical protein
MKSYLNILAAAAFVAVGAPALAGTQVKASPGVTLTESAQAKFNRDTRGDDRHVKPIRGSSEPSSQLYAAAGLTVAEGRAMTLDHLFVAKINRESRGDEQQAVKSSSVTMASRGPVDQASRSQLIAAAGLSAGDASGLTLQQIAAAKFERDTGADNR